MEPPLSTLIKAYWQQISIRFAFSVREYRNVCIFPFGTCFSLATDEILMRHLKIDSHQFSKVWYKCPQSSKTVSENQPWHSNSPNDLHPIRQQIPKVPLDMEELSASCQVPLLQFHFHKKSIRMLAPWGAWIVCFVHCCKHLGDSVWPLMCALKLVWTLDSTLNLFNPQCSHS